MTLYVWSPNIEGSISPMCYGGSEELVTGAFVYEINARNCNTSSGTKMGQQKLDFNASNWSDLYVENGSVQVQALQVLACIKF